MSPAENFNPSKGTTVSYVYIQSEPRLWTAGFYDPDGKFHPESDHGTPAEAAERVHWLNGGTESFVAGECGHPVAGRQWREGFRNCERCGG